MTQTSRPASAPELGWTPEGVPFSARFQDSYFSRADGLAETRHVFLAGTGLPGAWHDPGVRARRRFTIGETGFGTGLNILAAWALWQAHAPAGVRLHIVSAEAFPLSRHQMAAVQARFQDRWPEVAPFSRRLVHIYETPHRGFHRLHLSETVTLTLMHGDAAEQFAHLTASVDAWFLDGFKPSHNPQMWTDGLYRELARLSAPGARLATFTVAGAVRRGLSAAGFAVEKAPGFGSKRDMLTGRFTGPPSPAWPGPAWPGPAWTAPPDAPDTPPARVRIIGGGIAGAALAAAFRRRAIPVTLLDRHGGLAAAASGNPIGLVMARPSVEETPASRFHSAALLYLRHLLHGAHAIARFEGIVQALPGTAAWIRAVKLIDAGVLPLEALRFLPRSAASELAGARLSGPALFHGLAGTVDPPGLCRFLAGETELQRQTWDGPEPDGPDLTILANGLGALTAPDGHALGLRASLGHIAVFPGTGGPARPVTYGGYMAPLPGGGVAMGATYDPVAPQAVRADAPIQPDALERIRALASGPVPDLLDTVDCTNPNLRAAYRATTPDHMPLAGALPNEGSYISAYRDLHKYGNNAVYPRAEYWHSLYVFTGLGSRGLTTAPLAAELIASQICGDPWPVERAIADALHPARTLIRALKQPPDRRKFSHAPGKM